MEKCIPIRDYSKGIHVPLNTFLLANLKVHVYLLTICMHFKEKPFIYIIGSHIRVIIHRGGVLQFVFISNNHVYIGYIMRARKGTLMFNDFYGGIKMIRFIC